MRLSFKTRALIMGACLAAAAAAPAPAMAVAAAPASDPAADQEIANRVQAALHADRYFYDAHVTVSVEKGDIAMRGFVASDWDVQTAIRIAAKAAGERRVLNYLQIVMGGFK
ncbi:MAG TPA: BON domain-containing protein [Steroidobacteraceae bacterium]|nr:BON domain-containing protein [Steroidobacteraceae bacterium]